MNRTLFVETRRQLDVNGDFEDIKELLVLNIQFSSRPVSWDTISENSISYSCLFWHNTALKFP